MSKRTIRNCVGVLLVAAGLAIGTLAMGGATVVSVGLDALRAVIASGPYIDENG